MGRGQLCEELIGLCGSDMPEDMRGVLKDCMENETVLNAGVMFQFAAHVYQNSTKYTSEVQNLCRSLCMESVSTFRASSDKYNPSDIVDMVRKCQSLLPLVTSHMAIVPLVYQNVLLIIRDHRQVFQTFDSTDLFISLRSLIIAMFQGDSTDPEALKLLQHCCIYKWKLLSYFGSALDDSKKIEYLRVICQVIGTLYTKMDKVNRDLVAGFSKMLKNSALSDADQYQWILLLSCIQESANDSLETRVGSLLIELHSIVEIPSSLHAKYLKTRLMPVIDTAVVFLQASCNASLLGLLIENVEGFFLVSSELSPILLILLQGFQKHTSTTLHVHIYQQLWRAVFLGCDSKMQEELLAICMASPQPNFRLPQNQSPLAEVVCSLPASLDVIDAFLLKIFDQGPHMTEPIDNMTLWLLYYFDFSALDPSVRSSFLQRHYDMCVDCCNAAMGMIQDNPSYHNVILASMLFCHAFMKSQHSTDEDIDVAHVVLKVLKKTPFHFTTTLHLALTILRWNPDPNYTLFIQSVQVLHQMVLRNPPKLLMSTIVSTFASIVSRNIPVSDQPAVLGCYGAILYHFQPEYEALIQWKQLETKTNYELPLGFKNELAYSLGNVQEACEKLKQVLRKQNTSENDFLFGQVSQLLNLVDTKLA